MYIRKCDGVSYKAALPASMKADFTASMNNAKKIIGLNNGLSLLKIHSGSMPKQAQYDTGIGKLNSKAAMNFIKLMALYTGVNAIKEFPAGQMTKTNNGYYGPYNKTAVTFGEENINLVNIIENKNYYGNILTFDDIKEFTDDGKNPYAINYELELGRDENYPILKPLRIAYDNYKNGLATTEFNNDFNKYKEQDIVQNTYSRLALYPFIHSLEPDLFVNFDTSSEKQQKFEEYKKKYNDSLDFFYFRQFLAQKEHDDAKLEINKMGLDFFGDCLIGFAPQEVWAHPDAFMEKTCIGNYDWGLPALKFKEILNPKSEAHKVFDEKISFFLKNYDGVRFDVGWCYAIAKVGKSDNSHEFIDLGHELFDFIEKRAKEIKGNDYNTSKLIYETVGFDEMFTGWDVKKPKPIPNVRNIVNVQPTEYESEEGAGWGSAEFFLKTGLKEDELIMGTNNHDGANLRSLAEGTKPDYVNRIKEAVPILSRLFGISKQKLIDEPSTFVKAKFAEIFTVKNQFLYFTDVLGSKEDMDCQNDYTGNFRFRVDEDPERQYHTALQQGFGFNLPETLKMVMENKKLDKSNPEIYNKLDYYAKYLRKPGPKTEEDANNLTAKKRSKTSKSINTKV